MLKVLRNMYLAITLCVTTPEGITNFSEFKTCTGYGGMLISYLFYILVELDMLDELVYVKDYAETLQHFHMFMTC